MQEQTNGRKRRPPSFSSLPTAVLVVAYFCFPSPLSFCLQTIVVQLEGDTRQERTGQRTWAMNRLKSRYISSPLLGFARFYFTILLNFVLGNMASISSRTTLPMWSFSAVSSLRLQCGRRSRMLGNGSNQPRGVQYVSRWPN